MQDPGTVRCRQRVGDAGQQFDHLLPGTFLRRRPFAQGAAVHELRNQVLATLELAYVEHGQDVGVVEHRCHLGFALKTLARDSVGQFVCEKLDGHRAVEFRVGGTIDLAHAARADHGSDFVRPETSACDEGHGLQSSVFGLSVLRIKTED